MALRRRVPGSVALALALVAGVGPLLVARTPAAAATCPASAALYGVSTDGRLIGYVDSDIHGGSGAIANSGMSNPTWGGLTHVFSGGHGIIYGVTAAGVLKSYRDVKPLDAVAPSDLKTYGPNWDAFRLLWGNEQGVIYGVRHDGTLVTYKQSDPWNGNGSITPVGTFNSTWGSIRYAWSSGGNVFYGIDTSGTLHTYVHSGWSAGGGTIVNGSYTNSTWGQIRLAWSPAPGVIYGISTTGVLRSYRDNAPTTGAGRISGINYAINSTWGSVKHVFPDHQRCSSVRSVPPPGPAASAVTFALAQVGKPYVWGAEGPSAYDCSGLVWRAFYQAGFKWSRTTSAGQYSYGTAVSRTSAVRGDVLFWSNNGQQSGIYHVGIYLGNNQVVHAADERQGVIQQALWTTDLLPYAKRLQ